MPSILDGLTDNATLTFLQGDGTVTFDDDKNPVEGFVPPLVVKAMVKKDRNASNRHDRPPGIDWAQSIPVKGRLIDPAIIGLSQRDRTEPISAVVDGNRCRILLDPTLQSPAITRLKLLKLVGEKFTGWMVFDP
jgi:hypothetical protein